MSPCESRRRARGEDEAIRQDRVPRDLLQQVQELQHLIEHAGLVTGLVRETLQGPGRRCRHLQPLEAAFEDVDGENDVPVPGCLSLARSGAKRVSGLSRHERLKRLERSIGDVQPLLLALQPEAHGAGGGSLAERTRTALPRMESRAFTAMTSSAAHSFGRTVERKSGLGLQWSGWTQTMCYGRTGRNENERGERWTVNPSQSSSIAFEGSRPPVC